MKTRWIIYAIIIITAVVFCGNAFAGDEDAPELSETFAAYDSELIKDASNKINTRMDRLQEVGIDDKALAISADDESIEEIQQMGELISAIQEAVNDRDTSKLVNFIDPQYPKECFVAAEALGRCAEAYSGLISIVFEMYYYSENEASGSETMLSYAGFEKEGDYGALTYDVNTGSTSYRETINLIKYDGIWYITPYYENDYLYSIRSNGGYGDSLFTGNFSVLSQKTLEPFQRGNYAGFCTEDKEEVLQPYFEEVGDSGFMGNYCPVEMGYRWGFINKEGRLVVDYLFEDVIPDQFEDGSWWVRNDGKWGAVNFDTNETVLCQYEWIKGYNSRFLSVSKNDRYGVVSSNGKIKIPLIYEKIGNPSEDSMENELIPVYKDGYWGVVDSDNNVIVDFIYSETAWAYKNGVLAVRVNDAWGVIDTEGDYVVEVANKYGFVEINDVCIVIWTDRNRSDAHIYLFDFSGNPLLPDKDFKPKYLRFTNGNIILEEKKGSSVGGLLEIYYMIKKDGTYIALSQEIFDALYEYDPDLYEEYSSDYWSTHKIEETDNDFILVFCKLGNFVMYNFIDSDGNLFFKNWASDVCRSMVMVGDSVVYTLWSDEYEPGQYEWYLIEKGKEIDDAELIWTSKKECIKNNVLLSDNMLEWIVDGQIFYVVDTASHNKVVINTGSKTISTLSEYAGVDYEFSIVSSNDDMVFVVTDGIFYGMLTKDGLIGDGIVYTEYSYDQDRGVYSFIRGAETSESYRILPDGSAERT